MKKVRRIIPCLRFVSLTKISDKEFNDFVKDFGGKHKDPSKILRNYIDRPEWEPRIRQLTSSNLSLLKISPIKELLKLIIGLIY